MPRQTFGNGGIEALHYTGGHTVRQKPGYLLEYCPEHPACNLRGHVRQHRLVIERHLGRFLSGAEVVHHKNGDLADNRLENLELLPNQAAHAKYHQKQVAPRHDPEILRRLKVLADDPHCTPPQAAKILGYTTSWIWRVRKDHGWEWVKQQKNSHPPAYVLQVLRSNKREKAAKILGMTVMTLWRHYPEEMNKTARKKSLKHGGQQGGVALQYRVPLKTPTPSTPPHETAPPADSPPASGRNPQPQPTQSA
jgi:hypothetical protein